MKRKNQAETFLKLTLMLGLVIFHPCLGAQSAVIGNGGDVLTIEEEVVSPLTLDWDTNCDAWKSRLMEDVAKRQSKLLNIDCGSPIDQTIQTTLGGEALVGKGRFILQTDNFRGRLIKIEQAFVTDIKTIPHFPYFFAFEGSGGFAVDINEVNRQLRTALKKCEKWKDQLVKLYKDKNILAISCGTVGQQGRRASEAIGAVGTAVVAIDQ